MSNRSDAAAAPGQKTSAWPLALSYCGLIVYASLYPFGEWRDQGIAPWMFLGAHWPKYWTGFDVGANVLGYVPAGFLLALSASRSGRSRHPLLVGGLACSLLSLGLETLQSYLPVRVPSNVDFGLNALGGWIGAALAALLERVGAIDHWSRIRANWFVPDASGALGLLALWPFALLFPATVPFGLGQVFERLEAALVALLVDTPFLDWVPVRAVELQPLGAGGEFVCVLFGLLIPCLLGFSVIRTVRRRLLFALATPLIGVAATGLSAALTYAPHHAWDWIHRPILAGVFAAPVVAMALAAVPRRASIALALLVMGVYLSLINQAPENPYFALTLQTWEQGRFIRFHGLAQWLGWLWPYAVLVYLLSAIWRQRPEN